MEISDYLYYLIAGLGTGALFAGLAQGLVIAYRGSGVINFSHGAIAAYVAYTYYELRNSGRLLLPPLPNPLSLVEGVANRFFGQSWDLPDIPTFMSVGGSPWGFWAAFVVSLLVAAGLGLLLHFLVFRPLRRAPALAKVVAAVGVLLVIQTTLLLRFGASPKNVGTILPENKIEVFGNPLVANRLWLAGIAIVLGVGLHLLYKYTRFGLATRASAENEKGATLLGFSPDRQAALNWMLATVVAGFIGILASPITTLTPSNYTFFVLWALGAALLGSFSSFLIATFAGLGIGMLDGFVLGAKQSWTWLPWDGQGIREFVPLFIIIVAVFLRGKALPVRGALSEGRMPFAPRPANVVRNALVLSVCLVVGVVALGADWRQALLVSTVGVVISLSLVVLTGFVGQISLAQLTIAGFAAFALTRISGQWGIPFPFDAILAALVATAVGLVIGLPALRVRGVNLAIITLSFAFAFDQLVFNNKELLGLSGSDVELARKPSLFGISFGPLDTFVIGGRKLPNPGFGIFLVIVVTLLCVAVANLRSGSTGRRMLAVRSNERAAAAAGVSVMSTKLTAFGISSFIAGLGGVLISYQNNGGVSAIAFSTLLSITALATAYLGGISSVSGALVAGVLVASGWMVFISNKLFHAGAWTDLVAGIGLIVTAILNPEGIAGAMRHSITDAKAKRVARNGTPAPAPSEATAGAVA